jgi:hypothetical protein
MSADKSSDNDASPGHFQIAAQRAQFIAAGAAELTICSFLSRDRGH